MRISAAERRILEAAAAHADMYLSEYVRAVSLAAARRDLAAGNVEAVA